MVGRRGSRLIGWLGLLALLGAGAAAQGQDDAVYARVMRDKKLRVFAVQFPTQI